MQEPLFSGDEFHKCSVRHDRFNGSFIHHSYFRNGNDTFNPVNRFSKPFFLRTEYAYFSLVSYFFNIDGSSGFSLNFLYYLTTRSDNGTDEFFIDIQFHHSRSMRLHLFSSFRTSGIHGIENEESSLTGLLKRFSHGLHAQPVYFDIHLHGTNTFTGTGNFKVHIPQVVFITKDVGKNG